MIRHLRKDLEDNKQTDGIKAILRRKCLRKKRKKIRYIKSLGEMIGNITMMKREQKLLALENTIARC
jgi:hypothetical protein